MGVVSQAGKLKIFLFRKCNYLIEILTFIDARIEFNDMITVFLHTSKWLHLRRI